MTLKRIDNLSCGKIFAVMAMIIGLIEGIFYAFLGSSLDFILGLSGLGCGLGFLAIIVLPLIGGAVGFISGLSIAILYNLTAKLVGGIKLELE